MRGGARGSGLAEALLAANLPRRLAVTVAIACAAGLACGLACYALVSASTGFRQTAARAAVAVGAVGAVATFAACTLFLRADAARRRELRELAARADLVLRDPFAVQGLGSYREGELAVLANELEKMTVRLRDLALRLQGERDALADSLADVSHQLRTPLAAITLGLELLGRPSTSEERRQQLVRELRSQAEHFGWLASALLTLARSDAGALRVERGRVRVAELVASAVEPLRIALELRGQAFEAHLERGDESFDGDVGWSREALANIVKNCMEHTPAGGHVRVEARSDALATRIVVSDDGPGISAEDLPHVFERFYKGAGSAPGSAGIGLALARCLVSAQGGTLSAGNGPRGGARFEMTFPHVVA